MKLGEALTLRKDLAKRLQELTSRVQNNLVTEQGIEATIDPVAANTEAVSVLAEHYDLVRRINRTNSQSFVVDEKTISDLIVERDEAKETKNYYQGLVRYAKPRRERDEGQIIEFVSLLEARELQALADAEAKKFRELDALLQGANWTVDLLD